MFINEVIFMANNELDQLTTIELHIKKNEYEAMIKELEEDLRYTEESKDTLTGEALTEAWTDSRDYRDRIDRYQQNLHEVEQEINRKMNI